MVNNHLVYWYVGLGLPLVILGLAHPVPVLNRWDIRTFQILHKYLQPLSGVFRFLWPLGTTPPAVILIAMTWIPGWHYGLLSSLIYLGVAFIERSIKIKTKRLRPFLNLSNIAMSQPNPPRDSSHPSGDAMRVWFLAFMIPAAFNLSLPVITLCCALAGILCLGRIALGVHYPLDIIGGAGLGCLGSGIVLLLHPYII